MIEFFFAVFFSSGIIKSILQHLNISLAFDLTLLSAIIAVLIVVYQNYKNKDSFSFDNQKKLILASFLLFWLWIIISLSFGSITDYALTKSVLFGTNLIPVIVLLFAKKFDFVKFFKIILIIGLIVTTIFMPLFYNNYIVKWNANFKPGLYLFLGINIGLIFVIFLTAKIKIFKSQILHYVVLITLFLIIFFLAARSSILGSVIVILLFSILNIKKY